MGWFSIGLGAVQLLAPRLLTRTLGIEGRELMMRTFGMREMMAGLASLSTERRVGMGSRVVGDAIDLATLAVSRSKNPKRRNVDIALATVAGITAIDIITTAVLQAKHGSQHVVPRDYSDRSGLPKGIEASRGLAARVPSGSTMGGGGGAGNGGSTTSYRSDEMRMPNVRTAPPPGSSL